MTCWKNRAKKQIKKYSQNKIIPYDPKVSVLEYKRKICNEKILCVHCKKTFPINDDSLIHCNGCFQFFHCHIAGECQGKQCVYLDNHFKYCIDCSSIQFNKHQCLCKICNT